MAERNRGNMKKIDKNAKPKYDMALISLHWNRLHYSKQSIENLIKKTTKNVVWVFVDNGSVDGTREYLLSLKNRLKGPVEYVFNDINKGVAGGRNEGIKRVVDKGYDVECLTTIDDDVLVPDRYDVAIMKAVRGIPNLGISGVNVEPYDYPVVSHNGVRVRQKKHNLGGACLALPFRVFRRVGYYFPYAQYGLEDSDMSERLDMLKLIKAYIVARGVHLDNDSDKKYRKAKDKAHIKGSPQLKYLSRRKIEIKKGNIYVPYIDYDPHKHNPEDTIVFDNDMILDGRKDDR